MNALEQRLRQLGQELEFPVEPDLAPAVLARIDRRPFPWNAVAPALAVLAVALAAAFAVPQARTTILKWFHLRGVTVERVETLPPAVERSQAGGLGPLVPIAAAERELGFRLVLPKLENGEARRVHVLDNSLATFIVSAYGSPTLFSEYVAGGFDLLKKSAAGKTVIEEVHVNGELGLWLRGGPHTLTYFSRRGEFRERTVRIHGNVLLWMHGQITLRLEGKLTKAQALAIARLTD